MEAKTPIRNAATVILVRDKDTTPAVLMGQRGATAAFMPSKFVFPGGAVDEFDAEVGAMMHVDAICRQRLSDDPSSDIAPETLMAAAIRELWEETGLRLATKGPWQIDPHSDWSGFHANGLVPNSQSLSFMFRAITPEGRPRRFDARFFVGETSDLVDDPDDFSQASEELSHLQWIPIEQAAKFDLPFITQIVLAELAANLDTLHAPAAVPFYDNRIKPGQFRYIEPGAA